MCRACVEERQICKGVYLAGGRIHSDTNTNRGGRPFCFLPTATMVCEAEGRAPGGSQGGCMAWLDPQWFTLEALSAEWRRKDIRQWLIAVATTSIVLALLCQPETVHMALYIDSVGIDVALAVFELQLLVGLAIFGQQLVAMFRGEYDSDDLLSVLMRKTGSLFRYLREAMRGSFR